MSSILRALKKLENEPRHLEESKSLDSKFVPLADTAPQRTTSGMLLMAAGTGMACGLVILAGWWLFSEKSPPAAISPTVSRQISAPEQNRTQAPVVENIEVPAIAEKPDEMPAAEKTAALETAQQGIVRVPAGPEKPVFRTAEPAVTPGFEKPAGQTSPPEKTFTAAVNPGAAVNEPAEPEFPKLKDRDIKLQAVTWSKVPEKRIAVINSRILREGEMVSGYLINTINQDDVILSRDGSRWKLMFR